LVIISVWFCRVLERLLPSPLEGSNLVFMKWLVLIQVHYIYIDIYIYVIVLIQVHYI
jgi:hypothetical protein